MKQSLRNWRPRAVINRDFTLLLTGQGLSAVGNFMFDTTLVLWIGTVLLSGKSYAPAAVSGVMVSVCAATIVVGPLAGVFVDRWDKRKTMIASDAARMLLVVVLAIVVALPAGTISATGSIVAVYVVVVVVTAFQQFFSPARFTLIGDLVQGDEARANAAGKLQATSITASIIGPPLAAPLLFAVGAQWSLWIDAATFVISLITIWAIKVPSVTAASLATEPFAAEGLDAEGLAAERVGVDPVGILPAESEEPTRDAAAASTSVWREFAAGLRFVAGSRVLVAILLAIVVATLGTGALNTLDVFFVIRNLHVAAHWYGTLGMAEGIGGLLGALAAGWLCRRLADVRVFCGGVVVAGLLVVAYSRQDALWPAVAALALIGLPIGALNVAASPILLRETPRELLGRTMSVINPVQQIASMASALVAGWLLSGAMRNFHADAGPLHLGPIDTIFGVCGLLFVAAGLTAFALLPSPRKGETGTAPAESTPSAVGT